MHNSLLPSPARITITTSIERCHSTETPYQTAYRIRTNNKNNKPPRRRRKTGALAITTGASARSVLLNQFLVKWFLGSSGNLNIKKNACVWMLSNSWGSSNGWLKVKFKRSEFSEWSWSAFSLEIRRTLLPDDVASLQGGTSRATYTLVTWKTPSPVSYMTPLYPGRNGPQGIKKGKNWRVWMCSGWGLKGRPLLLRCSCGLALLLLSWNIAESGCGPRATLSCLISVGNLLESQCCNKFFYRHYFFLPSKNISYSSLCAYELLMLFGW